MLYGKKWLERIVEALYGAFAEYYDIPEGENKQALLEQIKPITDDLIKIECVGDRIRMDVPVSRMNQLEEYPPLDDLHVLYDKLCKRYFKLGFEYGVQIGEGGEAPEEILALADAMMEEEAEYNARMKSVFRTKKAL